MNPFTEDSNVKTDSQLVLRAQGGDRRALEDLVRRHQSWIYNTALRMVFTPDVAEDITQDVLVKMITRLSSFQGRSAFRTWLYRILANHVLDMKRTGSERLVQSLTHYDRMMDELVDQDPPDTGAMPVDANLLREETRICCLMGMLVCLARDQRFAFVIGAIWGANDQVGSEIMDISRESFRQKLSRARAKLRNFLSDRCGLVDESNRCHCRRKIKALIDAGYLDPEDLTFAGGALRKVRDVARQRAEGIRTLLETRCDELFADTPLMVPPDYAAALKKLLKTSQLRELYDLN